MLREVSVGKDELDPATWGQSSAPAWREIDRALRSIAKRRAALDAEEARWIREAEAAQIWRPLGMVNLLDYLERTCGYTPRVAHERIRIARALGELPLLTDALATGALPFTAVRELTRVVTPTTEASWVDAARGKNMRQIEAMVAGHSPGDQPDDPPDPEVTTHVVRLEISASSFATLRQARSLLDDEHGTRLDDDAFAAALARSVLEGQPSGRATYQIALTVCAKCNQGWQHGGGATVPVDAGTVARATCNAQHIGSVDAAVPERAYQDVSPAVARLVLQRDEYRCRVPGCRSARGLEIHHIIHRAHGGSHEPWNLVCLCSMHHAAHHQDKLLIRGTADALEVVFTRVEDPRARTSGGSAGGETGGDRGETVDASVVGRAADAETVHPPAGDRGAASDVRATHVGRAADAETVHPPAGDRGAASDVRATHVGGGAGADEVSTPPAGGDHGETVGVGTVHPPACGDRGASADGTATHVGRGAGSASARFDAAVTRAEAVRALRGLGWSPAISRTTVDAALCALGAGAPIERVIRNALQRCPRPTG